MPRDAAHRRAVRALGALAVGVFLFGFTSGPLRTCQSHPGHAPAEQSTDAAQHDMAAHKASQPDHGVPHREHEGCSCLGQCSLEHPHHMAPARAPALVLAPMVPRAVLADHDLPRVEQHWRSLPLARPPPAVV